MTSEIRLHTVASARPTLSGTDDLRLALRTLAADLEQLYNADAQNIEASDPRGLAPWYLDVSSNMSVCIVPLLFPSSFPSHLSSPSPNAVQVLFIYRLFRSHTRLRTPHFHSWNTFSCRHARPSLLFLLPWHSIFISHHTSCPGTSSDFPYHHAHPLRSRTCQGASTGTPSLLTIIRPQPRANSCFQCRRSCR